MGHSVRSTRCDTTNMALFTGKFVRTQNDNYEAVMEKLGVSWLLRKAAGASTPVMEISEAGGNWVIKTSTTMKTMELKFRLGEEFTENTADGRTTKTTVTQEGNTMVVQQKAIKSGEKSVRSVREFDNDGVKVTITVEDVVATQYYKRQ